MSDKMKDRINNTIDSSTFFSPEAMMSRVYGKKIENVNNVNDENAEIKLVSLDDIIDHPHHAFRVIDDDSMSELVDTILQSGIQTPILVTDSYGDMDLNGKYVCVSGHRRKFAARKAGLSVIPAFVKSLSEDEADILMTSLNSQREIILPSEKAKAYKIRSEALKRQVGRPKKEDEKKLFHDETILQKEDENLSDNEKDSRVTIYRYIKLNDLIKPWSEAADNYVSKETSNIAIPLTIAVSLSYFNEKEQQYIYQCCQAHKINLKSDHIDALKPLMGNLTMDTVDTIFIGLQAKNKKDDSTMNLKFFSKQLMKKTDFLFPQSEEYNSPEKREEIIIEAVREYLGIN